MADQDPKPGTPPEAEVEESVHIGDPDARGRRTSPWAWVPTVYFAQGLQYIVVLQLFAIIFVQLGVPNSTTLFWVGLLSLPWTLKPLWGPLVDRYWTKRNWTIWMQATVGMCFIGAAFALTLPNSPIGINLFGLIEDDMPIFFVAAIVFLALLAFAGATHDIACDGYYMLGMNQKKQAFFVGMRSTAFRMAMIFATGVLFWVAGVVQNKTGLPPVSLEARTQIENMEPETLNRLRNPMPDYAEGEVGIVLEPATIMVEPGGETEVRVRLSAAPDPDGPEVVAVVRQVGGDKSFSVKAKEDGVDHRRLEFDQDNWDEGFVIIFGLDHRVTTPVVAEFQASAGRIGFSWMFVCVICGGIMFLIFMWHQFVLPYPISDSVGDITNRPPFIVPLASLAVTVGVPLILITLAFKGLGYLETPLQQMTIGLAPAEEESAQVDNGNGADAEIADAIVDATEDAMDEALEVADEAADATEDAVAEVLGEDATEDLAAVAGDTVGAAAATAGPTELQKKGFRFFFNAGRWILIILIVIAIIKTPIISRPVGDAFHTMSRVSGIGFAEVFETFFKKHKMGYIVAFLLTFRLGEAQLAQIKNIFLIDSRDQAGLAMTLGQLGFSNSVVYLVALTVGGLLGGFVIARFGLKATTWFMVGAMHLPNLLYVWLAWAQPDDLFAINVVIGVESFGYGFGFTYFLMVMILAAEGPYKTAHYALCTGFMALGFMIPGMWSGYLQELVGYPNFFLLVMVFTIPGVLLIPFLPIPKDFGRKAIRT